MIALTPLMPPDLSRARGADPAASVTGFAEFLDGLIPIDAPMPDQAVLGTSDASADAQIDRQAAAPKHEDVLSLIMPPVFPPDLKVSDIVPAPPPGDMVARPMVVPVLPPVSPANVDRQGVHKVGIPNPKPTPASPVPPHLPNLPPAREPEQRPMAGPDEFAFDPVLPQAPPLQPVMAPSFPLSGALAVPPPALTRHLAGQLAAALPRIRPAGGDAVLTLDPARLGQVTLRWQTGEAHAAILNISAADPATADLLGRLRNDITELIRSDQAMGRAGIVDVRLDIVRADRLVDPRVNDPRPIGGGDGGLARDAAADSGASSNQAGGYPPAHRQAQLPGRSAVNLEMPAEPAAQSASANARVRLA